MTSMDMFDVVSSWSVSRFIDEEQGALEIGLRCFADERRPLRTVRSAAHPPPHLDNLDAWPRRPPTSHAASLDSSHPSLLA